MNKAETIIAVIEAFDEVQRLEIENTELRRRIAITNNSFTTLSEENDEVPLPRWFTAIYEYGRRQLFDKYTPYWHSVSVTQDDDGVKEAQKFESWFKSTYNDLPDFMSREDFLQEFEPELKALYEDERAKALKED